MTVIEPERSAGSGPLVQSKILNEEILAERRAQIIAAASELFLRKGFHQTSIREISSAVGWHMGTLYLYISKKEDVLYLITQSMMDAFSAVLQRLPPEPDPALALRKAAEAYFAAVRDMRREMKLLYRESASLAPEHRQELRRSELSSEKVFADLIREGIERGAFKPVDPNLYGHTFIALAHMWALKGWAIWPRVPFEDFLDHQLGILFDGLLLDGSAYNHYRPTTPTTPPPPPARRAH
ncbi:MAG: TetR family transcriptional regulator [Dehalococcoidia bacterium]|nr:TetR family transcriptional regulator [Dehalococcoidia bacterium]